jgi:hypothetical protein
MAMAMTMSGVCFMVARATYRFSFSAVLLDPVAHPGGGRKTWFTATSR